MEKLKAAVKGKKIILLGPPGSGKGNRSKDLKELGLVHVASGIALRARVRNDAESELSKKAKDYMKRGDLVPDDIVVPIVMEHLKKKECVVNGFVLDGFPRNKSQSEILFSEMDIDLVLYLEVPRRHLIYGIVEANRRTCTKCALTYSDFDPPQDAEACNKCGGEIVKRADDNAETIKYRLKLYEEETKAFLPDLEAKGIVELLPITVSDDEEVDTSKLKTLRGDVYRTETDQGESVRMLNLVAMRERLFDILVEKFM